MQNNINMAQIQQNGKSTEFGSNEKPALDTDEEDYRCGYFSWTPNWLQNFNTPRFLLACVCWFTFTQGFVVNGLIFTNFTSWERRYGLSGTQLAWISGTYDTAAAVFTLTFEYIGQWMHNGRILSIGAYLMGVGSFIMAMPHFLSGLYELGPRPIEICDVDEYNSTSDECSISGSSSYYGYFVVAQCFHAVGGAAAYTLGVPYMDDQIKTKNTPLYIGIMLGNAAFGPAIGFILGGYLISIYVDVNSGVNPDINPGDPRWVGAWWIGLLIAGCAAMTVGFLMGCFPRELPSAKKYKAERVSEAHKGKGLEETSKSDFGKSLKDVKFTLKTVFTNPVWIFLTISGIVESAGIVGLGAFLPKMMQFQFAQPPTQAAIYAGAVVVPGAAGGQILGGLFPKWLKLRMRGLLIQSLICSVVALFLSAQFLIRCDTIPIAGVTVQYFNRSLSLDSSEVDVIHPCNEACNCTTESYDPICGSDNIEYFTPCHAGCQGSYEDETLGKTVYTNCSCIAPSSNDDTAIGGICSSDCDVIGGFLILFLLLNLSTFISATSGEAATIRCVTDKQRSFAFGVQTTIVRLLGSVPGAIIIGAIFDYACLIYQEACDITGSCWIYDTQFISEGLTWACVVIKATSCICLTAALILYKPPAVDDDTMTLDVPKKGGGESEKINKAFENDSNEITAM